MKMVKSLLLAQFAGLLKAGPKAGPAHEKESGGIEGAGFGIYPDTEEVD